VKELHATITTAWTRLYRV